MTPLPFRPSPSFAARAAALALVLGGSAAATALSQDHRPGTDPTRTAVLAGPDASPVQLSRVTRGAPGHTVELRRVGGPYEAQAAAAALAGEGFETVVAVGADARGAVGQADAGEVGDGTRWRTDAR
jgi:hypothetical protein